MKRFLLILTASLLGLALLGAGVHDNAGEYGYQFLDIASNPVALALAGRGVHSEYALASYLSQPASSAPEARRSLGIGHTAWLDDTTFNSVYYSYSNRRSHFGLAFRNLDYGRLENRDESGELIGYYSPLDLDLTGNYALRINPALYAGVNAGLAYEKLNSDSSVGLHGDLGLTWLPSLRETGVSVAVRNLGLSTAMHEEATKLPLRLDLDLSKTFRFDQHAARVELSGLKAVDEDWKGALSAELDLFGMVQVRGGYKLNFDAEDLTAGLGFRWKGIGLDYGWASFSESLDDVHSLGLSYNF